MKLSVKATSVGILEEFYTKTFKALAQIGYSLIALNRLNGACEDPAGSQQKKERQTGRVDQSETRLDM